VSVRTIHDKLIMELNRHHPTLARKVLTKSPMEALPIMNEYCGTAFMASHNAINVEATWLECLRERREISGLMNFGDALRLLKHGEKLARRGWNGKGMFIYLVRGSTFQVSRPPLLGIYPEGTEIRYLPHIDMRTADGSCVPWLASQTDVLAEDWESVS
jgi:hypothetical protein